MLRGLVLLATLGLARAEEPPVFLDPWIDIYESTVPQSVCDEIIIEAERLGFVNIEDSIDEDLPTHKQSQDLYLLHDDEIVLPTLFSLIKPYLLRMAELVAIRKRRQGLVDFDEPVVDWIFLRKYSPAPDSTRNMLKLHQDTNEHSLNLALNGEDDYDGGGLFIARPELPEDGFDGEWTEDWNVDLPDDMMDYNWVSGVERTNTSNLIFPSMRAGDVIVYNNTVWHAVAPLANGTRYSLSFFWDTPEEDEDDACKVNFINLDTDGAIDLYWLPFEDKDGVLRMGDWVETTENTYLGHIYEARRRSTGEKLATWEIIGDGTITYPDMTYEVYEEEEEEEEEDEEGEEGEVAGEEGGLEDGGDLVDEDDEDDEAVPDLAEEMGQEEL